MTTSTLNSISSSTTTLPIESHNSISTSPELQSKSPNKLEPLSLEANPLPISDHEKYPEGGLHAWITVFGSFSILTSTIGFMTMIGTIQAYWSTHQLANYSSSTIGWITSILVFLSLILGVEMGPLFDRYGSREILFISSIIYVASFFVAAQCTRYWEFVLSIGILGGCGSAGLITVAVAAITHWFKRKRGLAIGLAFTGSSFGGVLLPIVLNQTLRLYGWQWSMRIFGFIVGGLNLIGNLCIKTRLPKGKQSGSISFKCFKSSSWAWATVGVFAFEFTLFAALALLPTYALDLSFSTSTSFAMISILNGFSGLGRFLASTFSDYYGHFNTMIIMVTWTLVVTISLWFPIGHSGNNTALLYVYSAMFGFGSGSVISLTPVCIGGICGTEEFGEFFGTCYCVVSFATLICIPASGQILSSAGPDTFIAFQAAMLTISLGGFCMARWAMLKYQWKWSAKI